MTLGRETDRPSEHRTGSIGTDGIQAGGIIVALGTTGVGKTYLAKSILDGIYARNSERDETRRGAIVLDSLFADNFIGIDRVDSLPELAKAAWTEKRYVKWTPKDKLEFRSFSKALFEVGNVDVLVDEIGIWPTDPEFENACRAWRHRKLTLILTGQHVGSDLGQVLLACNPSIHLFKITAPRSIDFMIKYLGQDPEVIRAQGVGEYKTTKL